MKTLFEVCAKCGWRLHAYVIMSNHHHLALETPEPNLVDGMRWLQGTLGIRFNAFRYKSLVIEEGRPLLGLVNYIHLNPVRAGIVEFGALPDFALSSFPKFFTSKPHRALVRSRFLAALKFPDSVSGMKHYARHLEFSEENNPVPRDKTSRRFCHGWAVGSEEYRRELKRAYAEMDEPAGWGGPEVAGLRESKWEKLLSHAMISAGRAKKTLSETPNPPNEKSRSRDNFAAALRRPMDGSPNVSIWDTARGSAT